MTQWPRLRASEWVCVAFFIYIAVLSHWFPDRPRLHHQPEVILAVVIAGFFLLATLERGSIRRGISSFRDFLPIFVTLIAFREMEYFLPKTFDRYLEVIWIRWDRILLDGSHLRSAIESAGWLIPSYLELSYLLVYGLPFYCVAVLYLRHRRPEIDRFFVIYLTGTLFAYGLFPFFPSQPPRLAFPDLDQPGIQTFLREINLDILKGATIHVGVFPSAHVSSAFAAAWAMFSIFPNNKAFGWILCLYAVSVSVATIYGRYHYGADVAAGFAVSLAAAAVAFFLRSSSTNLVRGPASSLRSEVTEGLQS